MGALTYEVHRIDGDYAWLKNIDCPMQNLVLVARALLPDSIREGTRLRFENFEYTLAEKLGCGNASFIS